MFVQADGFSDGIWDSHLLFSWETVGEDRIMAFLQDPEISLERQADRPKDPVMDRVFRHRTKAEPALAAQDAAAVLAVPAVAAALAAAVAAAVLAENGNDENMN